jgi:hypothetical protein
LHRLPRAAIPALSWVWSALLLDAARLQLACGKQGDIFPKKTVAKLAQVDFK